MADPEERLDLVAVGSAVVDRHYRLSNLPESDGGAFVGDSWRGFGGVAANVAATALRLGRNVGVLTRLGTDRHGAEADAILADLRDRGIHTSRLRRGDEPGAYSIVFVGPDRERMVVAGGESVRSLTLQAADWPYLRRARAVVTNYPVTTPAGLVLSQFLAEYTRIKQYSHECTHICNGTGM